MFTTGGVKATLLYVSKSYWIKKKMITLFSFTP